MSQRPVPTNVQARYMGPYQESGNSFYYWVQAIYPSGRSFLSAAGEAINAPAALTPWAFNNVSWNPAPGAIGYRIYRTTTSTAPTTGSILLFVATAETSIKDDGTLNFITDTVLNDAVYTARCVYNFAVDGGAVGAIIPSVSDTIPADAIVMGSVVNSPTAVTSGGSATVAVGTSAGSSADSILAATTKADFTTDAVLVGLASTAPFKMSAAGQLQITVAAAALTAGLIEVIVTYVMPTNP